MALNDVKDEQHEPSKRCKNLPAEGKHQAIFMQITITFNWPLQKIPQYSLFVPQNLHKHCYQFLLGLTMVLRENKNNAYAKFGGTNKEYYGIFRSGLFSSFLSFAQSLRESDVRYHKLIFQFRCHNKFQFRFQNISVSIS